MNKLNQQILRSGYKKKYLAQKLNISPVELSHIISGRRRPSTRVKQSLIKLLKKTNRLI